MAIGRSKTVFCSVRMRLMLAVSLFYGMHFVVPVATEGADLPTFPAPTREQARDWYEAAKEAFQKDSRNSTSAWKFAEACFEWAEFASHSSQRALLAHEGIAAAKLAVEREPESAAAHFYLAMNKGQLARTKTLGALPLVREMERSFQRAIALEPKFDNAAADRSLGMLYLDAPGWPTSIGNKSKARKHLERAVELCPEYPTNHLALMNAYLRWEDEGALHTAMERYRKLISAAKETYAGKRWENSWKNWDEEWKTIIEKSQDIFE